MGLVCNICDEVVPHIKYFLRHRARGYLMHICDDCAERLRDLLCEEDEDESDKS